MLRALRRVHSTRKVLRTLTRIPTFSVILFFLKGRIPTGNLPNFQRSRVCYAQRFRSNAFPTGFPHITLRSDINDAARTRERLTSDPGASAQITRTGRTAAGKPKSGHKSEDHHSERCLQKQRLTAARTKQRQKRASFLHSSFFYCLPSSRDLFAN